ncbi:GNAT family N-acetyltransferase [Francisella frigiditurris]|uniref:Acetyltransferase family protein n=1 Tax=Francisella frigiditurris TaxID=1542390 RepID=A0A1J0KVD9_9GAMM|nr:N-acetyltransferase [Francisella frigiditurris]APC97784.1 acetyltransferase family protein [Francisella frigiditurris]
MQANNILISHANLNQLDDLIEIENSLFNSDKISRRQMTYNIKKQKLFFTAVSNDSLAGYILCFEYKKQIRIYSLAVSTVHQGKGIAQSLLNHLFKLTTKNIYLEVNTNNLGAIRLYQKNNFVISKTISNYYENGDSAYKMTLRRD